MDCVDKNRLNVEELFKPSDQKWFKCTTNDLNVEDLF